MCFKSWKKRLQKIFTSLPKNKQEFLALLQTIQEKNLLDPQSFSMIEGVFQVSETQVREIMIPRLNMVIIEQNASTKNILDIVLRSGHSRFPRDECTT